MLSPWFQVPFSEFKKEFIKYWPKFIAHHNDARWHDDDFTALKDKLPCGSVGMVCLCAGLNLILPDLA